MATLKHHCAGHNPKRATELVVVGAELEPLKQQQDTASGNVLRKRGGVEYCSFEQIETVLKASQDRNKTASELAGLK